MRITKIEIPEEEIENGLKKVSMSRLGNMVILAGKNGAGKTRLLKLIEEKIKLKPTVQVVNKLKSDIKIYEGLITQDLETLARFKEHLQKNPDDERVKKQVQDTSARLTTHGNRIDVFNEKLKWDKIQTNEYKDNYAVVHFVPKELSLNDCNNFNKSQVKAFAEQVEIVGVNSLKNGCLSKIQMVQEEWFNATHQNSSLPSNAKQQAIDSYKRLQDIIELFLDTSIDRDIEGSATIFGFPLGKANLSSGQIVLLQLCLALFSQKDAINGTILFLDEPENHLHPSVLLQTIERLANYNSKGQIWISTHSLPLLSHFDPSNIWYMSDNKVKFGGQNPNLVLESLLGDESRIGRLQDFISLPAQYALINHAIESLTHPEVLYTGKKDPQSQQIKNKISKFTGNSGALKFLDFGAGKGRLLSNLFDSEEDSSSFSDRYHYVAYDKFKEDKEQCKATIERVYGDSNRRYYNKFDELFAEHNEGTFDVVILCNVLHEIDPINWLTLFGKDGYICKALSDKGTLIIVEDQKMPVGEKAYENGFLVLDSLELKELFSIDANDSSFDFNDARGDGRLKAHFLKKDHLIRINNETRLKAIKSLCRKSKIRISDIRSCSDTSYKNGKEHGFWIQQFANSTLVLDQLE